VAGRGGRDEEDNETEGQEGEGSNPQDVYLWQLFINVLEADEVLAVLFPEWFWCV
jgi:hypothetical protein